MTRGRKTDQIKRITKRQGETMKALARTGVMTTENAQKYFGLNHANSNKMEQNKYIRIEKIYIPKQGVKEVLKLESKGKVWLRNEQKIDAFYRSNNKQIQHDLKLNQFYCQLKEEQRSSWLNENQIIKRWDNLTNSNTPRRGTVDAIVTIDDVRVAIEVITNNYGEEEIQVKEEVARNLQCERMVIIKT
ncbi:TPA: hypothetical protein QCR75_005702 [Bacillus anthracis]|nr:hypothetical protein [Bacillus anthracis]